MNKSIKKAPAPGGEKQIMKKVAKQKAGLHHFVATGGKPKNFKGCQGVNPATVPGVSAK